MNVSLYHSNCQALKGEQGRVLKGCKLRLMVCILQQLHVHDRAGAAGVVLLTRAVLLLLPPPPRGLHRR